MRTLFVLLGKEFRQFVRNPFLPRMALAFPLIVMLVMPWVMTMDVHHIGISVVDLDRSTASRRLIQKVAASEYFTLYDVADSYAAALSSLEQGEVDVIVEIPDDWERGMTLGSPKRISISANSVNAMKGSLGAQYAVQMVMRTMSELTAEKGAPEMPEPLVVENRYNPTLNYKHFMIPALMIMLIIMLCGFLPALNLVIEKEVGTIEQINVTPVSQFTFTLAKLIPFWIIGLAVLAITMLLAWGVYGLVPAGSLGAIYLAALLFILVMSGLGVTIANFSSTMQQTMFLMFFFLVIFILLSGLMTPIESMPEWAYNFTYVLPPRYFIEIMRSVYLKGSTIADLWINYAALALSATLFCSVATLTYHKRS